MKGLVVTFQEYVNILKMVIGNHAIGKLFCELHKVKMEEKAYIIISAAFYIFSIYQNINTCIRFYSNMNKIHVFFTEFKKYIAHCESDDQKIQLSSLQKTDQSIICIGPEGDFTPDEIQLAKQNNFLPVTLGDTRLRTETAGMFSAVLLMS
jgi:16S rRNA (uracil1498-N3)-methyltransferase